MPEKKIKIGAVIDCLDVGGAQWDIVRNYPKINRDRFEIVVICFNHAGALAGKLRDQGIRVISRLADGDPDPTLAGASKKAGGGRGVWDWILLRLKLALKGLTLAVWMVRVLNREKIDIAHLFLPYAYLFGMLACLTRPKTKRLMSRLVTNDYQKDLRLLGFLERNLLHPWVHLGIGNCRAIVDDLQKEGMAPEKTRILYYGIDPQPYQRQPDSRARSRGALSLSEDAFVMVAVGNLHTRKRYSDLIEACALAADRLPENWRLLVAGRDQEGNRAKHTDQIQKRGLEGNIRLLGLYENVEELLLAADLFVHPSEEEGFPNAILEGMAASLPVVACRIAGIPELIVDVTPEEASHPPAEPATGWLVPPRQPERLSQALLAAASDFKRLREMGEQARQRILDHFTLEKCVKNYEALYREAMQ